MWRALHFLLPVVSHKGWWRTRAPTSCYHNGCLGVYCLLHRLESHPAGKDAHGGHQGNHEGGRGDMSVGKRKYTGKFNCPVNVPQCYTRPVNGLMSLCSPDPIVLWPPDWVTTESFLLISRKVSFPFVVFKASEWTHNTSYPLQSTGNTHLHVGDEGGGGSKWIHATLKKQILHK